MYFSEIAQQIGRSCNKKTRAKNRGRGAPTREDAPNIISKATAEYKVTKSHQIKEEVGHVTSEEMYGALPNANRNGITRLRVGHDPYYVFARTRPIAGTSRSTSKSSRYSANISIQSSTHQDTQSATQEQQRSERQHPHHPKNAIVWTTIRRLAIYRLNGL